MSLSSRAHARDSAPWFRRPTRYVEAVGMHFAPHPLAPSTAPLLKLKLSSMPLIEFSVPSDRFIFRNSAKHATMVLPPTVCVPDPFLRMFAVCAYPHFHFISRVELARARVVMIGLHVLLDLDERLPTTSHNALLVAQWMASVLDLVCLPAIEKELACRSAPTRVGKYRDAESTVHVYTRDARVDSSSGVFWEQDERTFVLTTTMVKALELFDEETLSWPSTLDSTSDSTTQ